ERQPRNDHAGDQQSERAQLGAGRHAGDEPVGQNGREPRLVEDDDREAEQDDAGRHEPRCDLVHGVGKREELAVHFGLPRQISIYRLLLRRLAPGQRWARAWWRRIRWALRAPRTACRALAEPGSANRRTRVRASRGTSDRTFVSTWLSGA